MALIKCPECGKEVSDIAPRCNQCGYPLSITSKTAIQEAVKTPPQEPPKTTSEIKQIQPQQPKKTKPFSIPLAILGFVIGIPALILIIFVATLGLNYLKYQAGLKKQIEGYQQNKQESPKRPKEPKGAISKVLEKEQATSDTSWAVFWQKYYKAVFERDSKTLKTLMKDSLDTNGAGVLTSEEYLKSLNKQSWIDLALTVAKSRNNFPFRSEPYAAGESSRKGDPIFSRDSNGNWKMSGFVRISKTQRQK